MAQQEVERGGQPWYYYLLLLPMYEFLPLLFSMVATIYYLIRGVRPRRQPVAVEGDDQVSAQTEEPGKRASEARFVAFLIFWTLSTLFIYSWAGEKMPWLVVHPALPMIILTAKFVGDLFERVDWRAVWRRGGALLALLLPITLFSLYMLIKYQPFQGLSISSLQETGNWLTALVVMVLLVVLTALTIRRLGARIVVVPYDTWWQTFVTHKLEGQEGLFIHPFADPAVIAGNGTIGLEILDELPEVDAVLIPYGGGGLSCGAAAAIRALKPDTKLYACEVETAAPLAASLAAGSPQTIERVPSFVDGIGGVAVTPEMWPLARHLLDASLVVTLVEVASAIRLLVERSRTVAEGAGAASVAAALAGKAGEGQVACVVSGGNIDSKKLADALLGRVPLAH